MLYALAKEGQAPKIFGKLNKRGVPVPALILTTAIGLFAFLTSFIGEGTAYTWIVNISGLCGFIAWVGIAVLTIASAVLSLHKVEILVNCLTKRGCSQWAQSWRSFFASSSLLVKTTPAFTGDTIDWYWRIRCIHWIANLLCSVLRLQIHQENKTCSIEERLTLDRDFDR